MSVFWEKWHPFILGPAAAAAMYLVFHNRNLPGVQQLLSMTVDLGAIAIGFLGTAKGILLSIDSSRVVQSMRQIGLYARLTGYIIRSIRFAFALVGVSLFGVLVDSALPKEEVQFRLGMLVFWAGVVTTVAFSCYQVVRTFFDALQSKAPKSVIV